MARSKVTNGWALVAYIAVIVAAVAAASLMVRGTDIVGVRTAVRNSARVSLLVLALPFMASSIAELWRGPAGKWLMRNRKFLGLGFAVSHFTHAAFLIIFAVGYWDVFKVSVGPFGIFGGGFGYLCLIAMTITSFDGPTKWLGRKRWKILHKTGMYVFWGIFTSSYIGHAVKEPEFLPMAAIVLAGWGLRGAAFLRKRNRLRAKAQRSAPAAETA
jgi:DMSO/TMAO reductase YedYZ heme-binding membrane subunit